LHLDREVLVALFLQFLLLDPVFPVVLILLVFLALLVILVDREAL
jgi:hypothetical protein